MAVIVEIFWLMVSFQVPLSSVTSIIDGLKKLYLEKLKPLEMTYRFNDFVSPLLVSRFIFVIPLRIFFSFSNFQNIFFTIIQ